MSSKVRRVCSACYKPLPFLSAGPSGGEVDFARCESQILTCGTPDVRRQFAQALSTFIPFLSQTSIPIANRLEMGQKEHDFHDKSFLNSNEDANESAVVALQLETVTDFPLINTRAGLYVFLHSLV